MYQVTYGSVFAGGKVALPPSKSAAIRAILCAALCSGESVIDGMAGEPSEDIAAAMKAARILGARLNKDGGFLHVAASGQPPQGGDINCGESGALSRFIIPIAAAIGGKWRFTGCGRLPERPMGVYARLLPEHGVDFRTEGGLPLEIEGRLSPGCYSLPGNISSQFVTGLMFALPLLPGDSRIELTSPLESKGYVDMTIDMLGSFGVCIKCVNNGWLIPGNQRYSPARLRVEGDWSHAAFFLNLAALSPRGAEVRLSGLLPDSLQGDRACVEVFGGFGLDIRWEDRELVACNSHAEAPFGGLRAQNIDVSQITDMVPAAAVCAALSLGETRFENGARLRLKESDRLASMEQAINGLGGRARIEGDALIVNGVERLAGGLAQGMNDHRVLMALAGAGLRSRRPVTVTDAWSIQKTYPDFYTILKGLGGAADVIQLG